MYRRRPARSWAFPSTPRAPLTCVLALVLLTAGLAAEVDGADLDGPPRGWASSEALAQPPPPPLDDLLDDATPASASTPDRIVQGLGPPFDAWDTPSLGTQPRRTPSPRAPRHALDSPPIADASQRDRVEVGLAQMFKPPPPPARSPPPNRPAVPAPPTPPPSVVRPGAPRDCHDIEALTRSLKCERGENGRLCASLLTRSLLTGCHDLDAVETLGPTVRNAAKELGLIGDPPPPFPPPRVPPPPPAPSSPPPSSPPPPTPPSPHPPPPPSPPPPAPPRPSPPPSPPPPSPPPPPWFTEQWAILTPGAPPGPPGPELRVPASPPIGPPSSSPPAPLRKVANPTPAQPSPPPWYVERWSELRNPPPPSPPPTPPTPPTPPNPPRSPPPRPPAPPWYLDRVALLDRAAESNGGGGVNLGVKAMADDETELTDEQALEWSSALAALQAAAETDDDVVAQAGDKSGGAVKLAHPPKSAHPPLAIESGAVQGGYWPAPGFAAAPGTTTYEEGAVTASAGRDALDRLLGALNWRRGDGGGGGDVNGEAAKASASRAALTYGFPQGFLWSVYRDPSIGPYLVQTWGHIQAALDPGGTYRP